MHLLLRACWLVGLSGASQIRLVAALVPHAFPVSTVALLGNLACCYVSNNQPAMLPVILCCSL